MEVNPTRMCELLVGLPEVAVLGVAEGATGLAVHIESREGRPSCRESGWPARVKDRPVVELVDLPVFGRPARLLWRKHRWACARTDCPVRSWTRANPAIGLSRLR